MMTAPPRAVLDSSVLVPAWSRLLLSTLAAAQPALYIPVWCEWIIAETWRVLTVQRLRRMSTVTPADERQLSASANAMLTALLQVMSFVSVVPPFDPAWPEASDADDLPIWSAAVQSGAQFIVSHNLRDFPPRDADGPCAYDGIEFVTAASFVTEILGLDLDTVAPLPITPAGRIAHQRRVSDSTRRVRLVLGRRSSAQETCCAGWPYTPGSLRANNRFCPMKIPCARQ